MMMKLENNVIKLPAAVQNVRLQREDVSLLDEVVKEKYEHFYNKEYSLNVLSNDFGRNKYNTLI